MSIAVYCGCLGCSNGCRAGWLDDTRLVQQVISLCLQAPINSIQPSENVRAAQLKVFQQPVLAVRQWSWWCGDLNLAPLTCPHTPSQPALSRLSSTLREGRRPRKSQPVARRVQRVEGSGNLTSESSVISGWLFLPQ